jgi:hypothetical protein
MHMFGRFYNCYVDIKRYCKIKLIILVQGNKNILARNTLKIPEILQINHKTFYFLPIRFLFILKCFFVCTISFGQTIILLI